MKALGAPVFKAALRLYKPTEESSTSHRIKLNQTIPAMGRLGVGHPLKCWVVFWLRHAEISPRQMVPCLQTFPIKTGLKSENTLYLKSLPMKGIIERPMRTSTPRLKGSWNPSAQLTLLCLYNLPETEAISALDPSSPQGSFPWGNSPEQPFHRSSQLLLCIAIVGFSLLCKWINLNHTKACLGLVYIETCTN